MPEINSIFDPNEAKKVIEVGNAITQADNALLKYTKDSEKLIELLKSQNISFEQLAKAHERTKKTTEDIDAVGKKLIQSQQKLMEVRDRDYKLVLEKRKQTQKETKDLNQLIRAQQAERGSIEQLSAVNAILEKRLKSVNLQTEEGRKRAERLRGAIDRNTKTIIANSSEYSRWKINIGNYGSALSGLNPVFSRVATGLKMLKTALLTNPITAIITLIAGAIALVVKALSRFQPVMDKFNVLIAQGKAVLDVLLERIGNFAKVIGRLLSGDLKIKDLGKEMKDAFSGTSEQIKNATTAAKELELTMQRLRDLEGQNAITIARNNVEIEKQLTLMRDVNQTNADRIAASQRIIELEKQNLDIQQEVEKERLIATISAGNRAEAERLLNQAIETGTALTRDQIGATITNAEEANELNKGIAAYIDLLASSEKSLQRVYTQRNSLIKQLNTEAEARKKANEEREAEIKFNRESTDNLRVELETRKDVELQKQELQKIELDRIQELSDQRNKIIEEEKKKELDSLKEKIDAYQQYTTIISNGFEDFVAGNKDALKEAAKSVILLALDTLQNNLRIAIAQATITSLAQPDSILSFGATGLARAAVLTGLMEAAFGAIKGVVAGFATGTENAPGRFVAGEKGRELMYLKTGEVMMIDRPTYFEGNRFKGATIKTNSETERIISEANKNNNFVFDTSDLKNEMIAVRKAIQKKPVSITDNSGRITGVKSESYREDYLSRLKR